MGCGLSKKGHNEPNQQHIVQEQVQQSPGSVQGNQQTNNDQEEEKQKKDSPSKTHHTPHKTIIDRTTVISTSIGFSKDYEILKRIGKARKYQVFLAQQKVSQQMRAVGVANKLKEMKLVETYKEQIAILKTFDHPNIVKIYGEYDEKDYYYCVSDYMEGGLIQERLDKKKIFTESQISQIIQQVLSALNYVHQAGYVHNNISPSSIIFQSKQTDTQIKLIGFGQLLKEKGEYYQQDRFQQKATNFQSPEQLKCRINVKSDIWSCGVLAYFLLSGLYPFNGKNETNVKQAILKGVFDFGWLKASEDAKQLIQDMLTYDNDKRPSAKKCLRSPWLQKQISNEGSFVVQSKQALANMMHYHTTSQAQNMFYTYMVNCMAPVDESNDLMQIFKEFDQNKDGRLRKDEIIKAYQKFLKVPDAEVQVAKIFKELDDNKNEYIDYTGILKDLQIFFKEFLMATLDRKKMLGRKNLIKMFNMLDKDRSGSIDLKELKKAFGGQQFEEEFWQQLNQEVDKNGDGKISKKEFINCMEGLLDIKHKQKRHKSKPKTEQNQ